MLSLDERVQILQALENDQAQHCGREVFQVTPAAMADLGDCGQIKPSEKIIEINREHIQRDELMLVAVSTTLHEGRHAYQRAAVADARLHPDPEQVRLWRENFAVYVANSPTSHFVYRFQAVERDADDFTETEMDKLFKDLEKRFGPVDDYRKYTQAAALEKQLVSAKAMEVLGSDYRIKIDRAIHRAFEKEHGVDRNTSLYRIRVKFEGHDWRSTHVAVEEKMDKDRLKEHLSRQAQRFILKEAGRMRIDVDPATITAKIEPLDKTQAAAFLNAQVASKAKERGRNIGF